MQNREAVLAARRAQDQADLLERQEAAAAVQHAAQNWTAVAMLCGLLGVIGFSAAGLLFAKDRVRPAAVCTVIGVLLATIGAGIFIARPTESFAAKSVPSPDSDFELSRASSNLQPETPLSEANADNEAEAPASESETLPEFDAPNNNAEDRLGERADQDVEHQTTRDTEEVDYNAGL